MKILQVDPVNRKLVLSFDGPPQEYIAASPCTAGSVADTLSKVIAEMGQQSRLTDDEVLWLSNLAAGVRLIADNES